ncbi:peroxisome assembly protein 26-like isoform X2 [Mustelus asterias]
MRGSALPEPRKLCDGPGQAGGPGLTAVLRAAERLQLQRDFPGALEASVRGLEQSGSSTLRSSSDVRFSLCIIGIQALAELNQWEQVLGWVLEIYEIPEKIPAKILQICIALYSKVGEPGRVHQTVEIWLKYCNSPSALGCGPGLVLEMYLLHVLLPLGLHAEAEEVILDTVLLTEQQRGTMLQVIENRRTQQMEQASVDSRSLIPAGCSQRRQPAENSFFKVIQQVLALSTRCLHSIFLRKLFLAVFLAYLLIVRLDPASPAAISWLPSLRNIISQIWKTMFAPYNKARIGKSTITRFTCGLHRSQQNHKTPHTFLKEGMEMM